MADIVFLTLDAGGNVPPALAIARELAERMQGELEVRSVPGRTTFALVLPA